MDFLSSSQRCDSLILKGNDVLLRSEDRFGGGTRNDEGEDGKDPMQHVHDEWVSRKSGGGLGVLFTKDDRVLCRSTPKKR